MARVKSSCSLADKHRQILDFEQKHFVNSEEPLFYNDRSTNISCLYHTEIHGEPSLVRVKRPSTRRHPSEVPPPQEKVKPRLLSDSKLSSTKAKKNKKPSKTSGIDCTDESEFKSSIASPILEIHDVSKNKKNNTPTGVNSIRENGSEMKAEKTNQDHLGSPSVQSGKKKSPVENSGINTKIEEHEYLQFLLRVTEDIILNNYYLNEDIERVFKQHMDMNKDTLNQDKMLHHISKLAEELNMTEIQAGLVNVLNNNCMPFLEVPIVNVQSFEPRRCDCVPDISMGMYGYPSSTDYVYDTQSFQNNLDEIISFRHSLGRVTECTEPSHSSTTSVTRGLSASPSKSDYGHTEFMELDSSINKLYGTRSEILNMKKNESEESLDPFKFIRGIVSENIVPQQNFNNEEFETKRLSTPRKNLSSIKNQNITVITEEILEKNESGVKLIQSTQAVETSSEPGKPSTITAITAVSSSSMITANVYSNSERKNKYDTSSISICTEKDYYVEEKIADNEKTDQSKEQEDDYKENENDFKEKEDEGTEKENNFIKRQDDYSGENTDSYNNEKHIPDILEQHSTEITINSDTEENEFGEIKDYADNEKNKNNMITKKFHSTSNINNYNFDGSGDINLERSARLTEQILGRESNICSSEINIDSEIISTDQITRQQIESHGRGNNFDTEKSSCEKSEYMTDGNVSDRSDIKEDAGNRNKKENLHVENCDFPVQHDFIPEYYSIVSEREIKTNNDTLNEEQTMYPQDEELVYHFQLDLKSDVSSEVAVQEYTEDSAINRNLPSLLATCTQSKENLPATCAQSKENLPKTEDKGIQITETPKNQNHPDILHINGNEYILVTNPIYVLKSAMNSELKLVIQKESLPLFEDVYLPENESEKPLDLEESDGDYALDLKLLGSDYDFTPERDTTDKYHFLMTDVSTSMSHVRIPSLTSIQEENLLLGNQYELNSCANQDQYNASSCANQEFETPQEWHFGSATYRCLDKPKAGSCNDDIFLSTSDTVVPTNWLSDRHELPQPKPKKRLSKFKHVRANVNISDSTSSASLTC